MPLREDYCRTSSWTGSACAGGAADRVVTTYQSQEGNATTPSNLRLIGTAVTADGVTLRSCVKYDTMGRTVAETPPAANLGTCS